MQRLICILSLCIFSSACSDPMPQGGQASHTWSNGDKYVGEWKDGKPHGEGTATYVGVGQYVGSFKKGKPDGHGEASYVDGRKYVGEWKSGDPWEGKEYAKDGKVIAKYSEPVFSVNGNTVVESDSSSDIEKLRWDNGHEYIGQMKDGTYHGQGTYTWPNDHKYDGQWKNGKPDGRGTHLWADGRKYVGEWRDGKRYGRGTQTFPDGSKYIGEWKNGKYHGQGIITVVNGNKDVGEFRSSALWHGVRYGNDGHVIGMMSAGVWKLTN